MSKQTPMLMESLITRRIYIVTSYVDNGDGTFTARQKYDVTEQFEAIANHRERSAELESLVRDMYADFQRIFDGGRKLDYEQRMAALGLLDGDAE